MYLKFSQSSTIFNSISNESTIDQDENTGSDIWNTSASVLSNGDNQVSCVGNLSEDLSTEFLQPSSSHGIRSNTVSIAMEIYKKLCQDSIDLIKANRTINKLNDMLRKKDAVIEKLKEERLNPSLSPVS